jgi:hypothetical protein
MIKLFCLFLNIPELSYNIIQISILSIAVLQVLPVPLTGDKSLYKMDWFFYIRSHDGKQQFKCATEHPF